MYSQSETGRRPEELRILLVEDNPADVKLLEECLKQTRAPWKLFVAGDGDQAISKIRTFPHPDLVLLDLNLPRKSGHDVLRELKSDPQLRAVPVIILSSSKSASDINAAYEAYANCYVSKPADLDQYFEVIQLIEDFWHNHAELPSSGGTT